MLLTLPSRRLLAFTICLLIGTVAIHQYRVTYDVHRIVVPFREPFWTAYSILHFGIFGNPFSILNTGPSAHLVPLFPGFLAGVKSDQCPIPNSQFLADGTAELRAVSSDKDWASRIE